MYLVPGIINNILSYSFLLVLLVVCFFQILQSMSFVLAELYEPANCTSDVWTQNGHFRVFRASVTPMFRVPEAIDEPECVVAVVVVVLPFLTVGIVTSLISLDAVCVW